MADRKRILVADDDPDLLDLLKMNLSAQGYEILTAANGRDALQIASSEPLDLAILDVMMPYVDGYHVANEIAGMSDDPPRILIMTSRDSSREKGVAALAGAVSMLQKPFTLSELNESVAGILEKGEQ